MCSKDYSVVHSVKVTSKNIIYTVLYLFRIVNGRHNDNIQTGNENERSASRCANVVLLLLHSSRLTLLFILLLVVRASTTNANFIVNT